jgi:26S proteasome regulatory subunit N2
MFERCFQDGEYRHAIGVALEARRLDKVEQAIRQSGDMVSLLSYTFKVVMELVSIDFRATVRFFIPNNEEWGVVC